MNPWVEKILFAAIPLLLSGVVYLFSTVVALEGDLNTIKNESAIARQELKEEVRNEITENKIKIAVLQEQIKQLQQENKK